MFIFGFVLVLVNLPKYIFIVILFEKQNGYLVSPQFHRFTALQSG